MHGARPGPDARDGGRVVHPGGARGRPGRRGGGVPRARRARAGARRRCRDSRSALRELGVVAARAGPRVVRRTGRGGRAHPDRAARGGRRVLEDILPELPIAPECTRRAALLQQALELFERLGDRRGAMSTIIALGYLNWAPDIHLGTSSAPPHRGDPPADVEDEGVHERERARGVRSADALRRRTCSRARR